MSKTYTHVALFSGAGGLDIGLEQAGFHTIWANDFNHDACELARVVGGELYLILSEIGE